MAGKFYTVFICLFLLFGLQFYSIIGFSFIDEILVLILVAYTLFIRINTHRSMPKEFVSYLWIMVGYLVYSLCLRVTSPAAIFYDVQQQLKPFLTFYCTIYLMPGFTKRQAKLIQKTCNFSFIIALCYIPSVFSTKSFMEGHVTTLAALAMTLFLIRYFFLQKRDKLSLFMLSMGIFSGRSKFFVTYTFSIFFLYYHRRFQIFKIKNILLISVILSCIIYLLIWDKFQFYFVHGLEDDSDVLRTLFYKTSLDILCDYFPLGSGFATFANYASGVFYSPLYYKYNLWQVYGATPDNPMFVADTFYPQLSQYGFVGFFLFFYFFYKRYKEVCLSPNIDRYILGMILICTILFESVADTTILSNRGVLYFMMLGFIHNQNKLEKKE